LPDYQTINFQTGIAADTLAFGSIRMADWKNHQLAVAPQTLAAPTSSFTNSTTYSLGVGRKLSDDLSLSLSTNWENGTESSGTSLLSPTNGYNGYSLGAKYDMDNLTLSGGVNYTTFGDKTITSTIADEFSGNSVLSYGIKLGVNF
jgi:long-chain fatty acid transport protein